MGGTSAAIGGAAAAVRRARSPGPAAAAAAAGEAEPGFKTKRLWRNNREK